MFFYLLYYISCESPDQDSAVEILERPDDWSEEKNEETNSGDTQESVIDKDGDGQASIEDGGEDCDDWDPNTYNGAQEQEDGEDNDCDGYDDWDGIFEGNLQISSQAIFEGDVYAFEDDCSGTIFRQNGQIEISFLCSITERPMSDSLLGAEILIETQANFVQGESWSGDVMFVSSGGDFLWDSQGEISLRWSDMNANGARQIDVSVFLDAIYLDIWGAGTVEK